MGLGAVHVKDEGHRLGLGSFKALGGAYAVCVLVLEAASQRLGRPVDIAELHDPQMRAVASELVFACATDGNHGKSVAQGAKLVGARSIIFVHARVTDARVAAIASFGAEIRRFDGTYDESVEEAARVATAHGWMIVSDTSWPGYERIPAFVMQGYTAMIRESLSQLAAPPTHILVQAGVGGVAAAVAGYLAMALGEQRPMFVVVDPARAACIYETAKAGRPVKVQHGTPTVMGMLECYEPSPIAWRVLSRAADAFMIIDDADAIAAMRRLATPATGDPAIVAGESGGAGFAGLMRACCESAVRASLGLDATSRILVFNTEGATDPDLYADLVGRRPEAVAAPLAAAIR